MVVLSATSLSPSSSLSLKVKDTWNRRIGFLRRMEVESRPHNGSEATVKVLQPPHGTEPITYESIAPQLDPQAREHTDSEGDCERRRRPDTAVASSRSPIPTGVQTLLSRTITRQTGSRDTTEHDVDLGARLSGSGEEGERTYPSPASDEHEESKIESGAGPEPKQPKRKELELQDQTNMLPAKQVILVCIGLSCSLFCSTLDQTIVTTALPTIGRVFRRADIVSWVGTAYLLTSTAFQPICGRLSDIFGRKYVLLGSLLLFMLGSLACALAQSMIQLIVFRAIQGIGGGCILTLAMIIMSDVVTLKERGKYQGIMGSMVLLGRSLGPTIGGIFTEKATWRWCFWINVPMSAAAMTVIVLLLPLKRVRGGMIGKLKTVDWFGSMLTLAWVILFLLGMSWAGNQFPWLSAAVLAPIFIGLALLGLFIVVEWKLVRLPLIPLRIFRSTHVAAGFMTSFFSGVMSFATLYYLPTYFQVVRGDSPIRSGLLLLPLVVIQVISSFGAGLLVSKFADYYWNLVVGFAMWSIGLGLLSTVDASTSIAKLVGYQLFNGVGAGQTFQTSLVAIQAGVDRKEMATATGLRNFLRQLGGTLAVTICSTIVNNIVRNRIGDLDLTAAQADAVLTDPTQVHTLSLSVDQQLVIKEAYALGIRACFWFMVPCAVISTLVTILFIKRMPLERKDDADYKAAGKARIEEKKAKGNSRHKSKERGAVRSEAAISDDAGVDKNSTPTEEHGGLTEGAGIEPPWHKMLQQGDPARRTDAEATLPPSNPG